MGRGTCNYPVQTAERFDGQRTHWVAEDGTYAETPLPAEAQPD